MTTTSTQDTHPYGGYGISGYRSAGGEETERFEAFVTLHGQRVIHVSNAGEGGCHRYQPARPGDYAGFRDALTEFEDYATMWNRDGPYAGIEDSDALVYRLLEVDLLNRKRSIVFTLDGEDFFETGRARRLGTDVAHEDAVAYLRQAYAGRHAAVWNKQRSAFVPID